MDLSFDSKLSNVKFNNIAHPSDQHYQPLLTLESHVLFILCSGIFAAELTELVSSD